MKNIISTFFIAILGCISVCLSSEYRTTCKHPDYDFIFTFELHPHNNLELYICGECIFAKKWLSSTEAKKDKNSLDEHDLFLHHNPKFVKIPHIFFKDNIPWNGFNNQHPNEISVYSLFLENLKASGYIILAKTLNPEEPEPSKDTQKNPALQRDAFGDSFASSRE
jgi:hypothetical protein